MGVINIKNQEIIDILGSRNIVIPIYMYKLFPKLNIDLESFIFLMYLYNCGDKVIFDPVKISNDFIYSVPEVLMNVDKLVNAGLVSFEIIKNDKNFSEEYLSLDFFIKKLSVLLVQNTVESSKKDCSSIFETIEKEFGRVLSPIEYEIIKAWNESSISDELIKEALKEAVFNGVSNLRYIDKILYEWQKKGYKTKEDVEKNRKNHKPKTDKIEVFEYNWLEDDE